jgi:hypothetical protein
MNITLSFPNRLIIICLVSLLMCIFIPTIYADANNDIEISSVSNHASKGGIVTVAVPNNLFARLKQGRPVGIIVEVTDHILKKLGYTMRYISMSNKDMKIAVHSGHIDVGTSMLNSPTNQKKALYSDAVIVEYNVLMTRKGESFDYLGHIENIRKDDEWYFGFEIIRVLGARAGFRYPLLEKHPAITLQRNRTDGENVRKLFLKELDAIIIGGVSDLYQYRAEGIMGDFKLLESAVGSVDLGIALADKRFTQDDLARFNEELSLLKASPTWDMILEKNGMLDLVRTWPIIDIKGARNRQRGMYHLIR